jgi:hypothetical protein
MSDNGGGDTGSTDNIETGKGNSPEFSKPSLVNTNKPLEIGEGQEFGSDLPEVGIGQPANPDNSVNISDSSS